MSAGVTAAVCGRVSTRAFLQDKPVPLELIKDILEVASRAPSGGNTQPWHLYVLAGEAREALVHAIRQPGAFSNGKLEFEVYPSKEREPVGFSERKKNVAFAMYDLLGVDRKDAAGRQGALVKNWQFFGAPVGIIVTVDRACDRNAWGHVGMLLQSICLLAEERGLASCLQEAWGNLGVVYKTLSIPDSEVVWCGLALGYADPAAPVNTLRTAREPVDAFAQFRGFSEGPSKL
mmetsp:Transcript_54194/g.137430  ORF Transcript_54194/g.137430 Transcript_54194/m.137430 type:complete len:233 (-) Transcript_54194:223-921(-)